MLIRGTLLRTYKVDGGFHSQNKKVLVFEPVREMEGWMVVQNEGQGWHLTRAVSYIHVKTLL